MSRPEFSIRLLPLHRAKALGALSSSIKQFRPASLARYSAASAASRTSSGVEWRFDRSAIPILMLMLTLGALVCFVAFAGPGLRAGRSGLRSTNPRSAMERRSDYTNGSASFAERPRNTMRNSSPP